MPESNRFASATGEPNVSRVTIPMKLPAGACAVARLATHSATSSALASAVHGFLRVHSSNTPQPLLPVCEYCAGAIDGDG